MKRNKHDNKIPLMREGGRITARIIAEIVKLAQPGIATMALEARARRLIKQFGAGSAFLNFEGYPAVLCVSVNEVAVHGLPSRLLLKEGDIVGIDFGVRWKEYCTDAAVTVGIGTIKPKTAKLIAVTKEALNRGLAQARAGNHIGDIGAAIQRYVEAQGLSILKELVGHGIGTTLHEPPNVPNFGKRGAGPILNPGMTIAIEPIVSAGKSAIRKNKDGFGYETVDGSPTAHFEHTILITENDPEILTDIQ